MSSNYLVPCPACHGSGRHECGDCGGAGVTRNYLDEEDVCASCQGLGQAACVMCHGSGASEHLAAEESAASAHTSLRFGWHPGPCNHCGGSGILYGQRCGYCNGTGIENKPN